jgi:hypothetical protein
MEEAHGFVRLRFSATPVSSNAENSFAIAIIIRLTYGIEVTGPEDPLIELADKGGKTVSEGGPAGATFVDIFPFGKLKKGKGKNGYQRSV